MSDDMPVAVLLSGVLGEEVRAFAETEVGWQLVDVGAGLRPEVALAEHPVELVPWVHIVDGVPSAELVRTALQAGAIDVIGWPADRERLRSLPLGRRRAVGRTGARGFTVAGVAGGVGTSTVALGVAALLATAGQRTTVVGGDDLLVLAGAGPWQGPGAPDVAALDPASAAEEVQLLSLPVPGLPGLRLLGGGAVADTDGWPGDVVVIDAGTARGADVQLLCARPDAHLPAAGENGDGRPSVLLVGDGPLPKGVAQRVLGSRLVGAVPWSARVGRAGAAGRVPSGLPGSWLDALRAALGGVR
jgi:hypothetical protein